MLTRAIVFLTHPAEHIQAPPRSLCLYLIRCNHWLHMPIHVVLRISEEGSNSMRCCLIHLLVPLVIFLELKFKLFSLLSLLSLSSLSHLFLISLSPLSLLSLSLLSLSSLSPLFLLSFSSLSHLFLISLSLSLSVSRLSVSLLSQEDPGKEPHIKDSSPLPPKRAPCFFLPRCLPLSHSGALAFAPPLGLKYYYYSYYYY